jgi:hypothetical protein
LKPSAFPRSEVERQLLEELLKAERAVLRRQGKRPPDDARLAAQPIDVDSLGVVEVLATLDRVVGFQVSHRVVRPGGYISINDAVARVTSAVEAEFKERQTGKRRTEAA